MPSWVSYGFLMKRISIACGYVINANGLYYSPRQRSAIDRAELSVALKGKSLSSGQALGLLTQYQ